MRQRNYILMFVIGALGLWAGYSQYRADRANELQKIATESARLADRDAMDALLTVTSNIRENTVENAKLQGRIEGMISVSVNLPPESNATSGVWHDGYQRGMSQTKFIEELAYERGYHAATNDGVCPAGKDNLEKRVSASWASDQTQQQLDTYANNVAYSEKVYQQQIEAKQKQIDELNNVVFNLRAQLGEVDAKNKTTTSAAPMPASVAPAQK